MSHWSLRRWPIGIQEFTPYVRLTECWYDSSVTCITAGYGRLHRHGSVYSVGHACRTQLDDFLSEGSELNLGSNQQFCLEGKATRACGSDC